MKHKKLKLDCMCQGSHFIEIDFTDDEDWPCIINMCGVNRGFWQKIKDLFKNEWFVDDVIISKEQIKSLHAFVKINMIEMIQKEEKEANIFVKPPSA